MDKGATAVEVAAADLNQDRFLGLDCTLEESST